MDTFSMLDDHEVEAILTGTAPGDDELATVLEALRRAAALEPVPPMGAALTAQLTQPNVVPLTAHRLARRALAKTAVAAAAIAVALMGVGATQNRLPARMQDVVSSTAHLLGIDVPSSDERAPSHDHGRPEDAGDTDQDADGQGKDGLPGYEGTTPGGADPADPGTPGDKEPAIPATPPATREGGKPDETGKPDTTGKPDVTDEQDKPDTSGEARDGSAPVEAPEPTPDDPEPSDEPGSGAKGGNDDAQDG